MVAGAWGFRRPWGDDVVRLDYRSRVISRGGVAVPLGPVRFRLAAALVGNAGALVSWQELIEALYGDDAAGGPEDAHAAIGAHRLYAGRRLVRLGIRIVTHWGFGLEARLEPLP